MLNSDEVFVILAGVVVLGFVLDALFDKIRITSVLPLMLIGIALVQFGVVSQGNLGELQGFIPYVSALTIAFILFSVGLEIRAGELYRVLGRATAYTFAVQTASGVAISLIALVAFHWNVLLCFVFGFGLSGPSSVAVPLLVRVTKVGASLKTALLFESVVSDLLQLLVPLSLIGIYQTGSLSVAGVGESLMLQIVGAAGAGILAAILWLWFLGYFRDLAEGYTWTLTITIVLATYGLADLAGLSAAITIFVFGVVLGNSLLLDRSGPRPSYVNYSHAGHALHRVRRFLRLQTTSIDIAHIEQVQREVAFFASTFFFVYLGLLFDASQATWTIVVATLLAAVLMLLLRFAFLPLLHPYLDSDPTVARTERGIVGYNISRGLAAAVIATIPFSDHIPNSTIPGFLDAMFFGILFSNIISTAGIYWLYHTRPSGPTAGVGPPTVTSAGPLAPTAPPPPGAPLGGLPSTPHTAGSTPITSR
ncbi:MAG: cation:proton antiporter [Thermoplasmata archaeon]